MRDHRGDAGIAEQRCTGRCRANSGRRPPRPVRARPLRAESLGTRERQPGVRGDLGEVARRRGRKGSSPVSTHGASDLRIGEPRDEVEQRARTAAGDRAGQRQARCPALEAGIGEPRVMAIQRSRHGQSDAVCGSRLVVQAADATIPCVQLCGQPCTSSIGRECATWRCETTMLSSSEPAIGGLVSGGAARSARPRGDGGARRRRRPGGKLREVTVGGRAIDAGPTVFTMRGVFDDIFDAAARASPTI